MSDDLNKTIFKALDAVEQTVSDNWYCDECGALINYRSIGCPCQRDLPPLVISYAPVDNAIMLAVTIASRDNPTSRHSMEIYVVRGYDYYSQVSALVSEFFDKMNQIVIIHGAWQLSPLVLDLEGRVVSQ